MAEEYIDIEKERSIKITIIKQSLIVRIGQDEQANNIEKEITIESIKVGAFKEDSIREADDRIAT